MKHYLYKITNIETGEYYLGVRSHKNPEKDSYMGSSLVWTKKYIRENRDILVKEILDDSFETRDLANDGEVILLQQNKDNPLCVNRMFSKNPTFFGHHHTEEAKRKQSRASKGKPTSVLQKETASKTHKGKIVSEETRKKQSDIAKEQLASGKRKKRSTPIAVEDITTNIVEFFDSVKEFSDKYDLSYGACQDCLQRGHLHKKKYKLMYINNSRTEKGFVYIQDN